MIKLPESNDTNRRRLVLSADAKEKTFDDTLYNKTDPTKM